VLDTSGPQPPDLRAKAFTAMGILSEQKGELDAARSAYGESLTHPASDR
jgi:hypothetical protein